MKIGVKIMQSEFGISVLRNGHESVSLSTLKWSFFISILSASPVFKYFKF